MGIHRTCAFAGEATALRLGNPWGTGEEDGSGTYGLLYSTSLLPCGSNLMDESFPGRLVAYGPSSSVGVPKYEGGPSPYGTPREGVSGRSISRCT